MDVDSPEPAPASHGTPPVAPSELEDDNMVTPRKQPAKRTRDMSDSESSASRHTKAMRRSTSQSTAVSRASDPIPSKTPSTSGSPEPALQGASRTTGGLIRGKAIGNHYNFGDKLASDMDFEDANKPVHGKVLLYTNRAKDADPDMSIKLEVHNELGSILDSVAKKYSPIKNNNGRIFVFEDNTWSIKGKFDEALKSTEQVDWTASQNGGLTLSIMSEVDQSGYYVASSSGARSNVSGSHVSGSTGKKSEEDPRGPRQKEIIALFNIPESLLDLSRRGDVQYAYIKWQAYLDTTQKINQAIKDGTWNPKPKVKTEDIVRVFFYKTTFYKYPFQAFPLCEKYPRLLSWVKNEKDAPDAEEFFGKKNPSFEVLLALLEGYANEEKQEKGKGKGKAKEVEKPGKEKKSHKKGKK